MLSTKYQKFFGILFSATVIFSSVRFSYADILINRPIETPFQSPQDYATYVRDILMTTSFDKRMGATESESLELSFDQKTFTIRYKTADKTNLYQGEYGIGNDSLWMDILESNESSLYGFYNAKDLTENPVRIENQLIIGKSDVKITLKSDTFQELNGTVVAEIAPSNTITDRDKQQMVSLDQNQTSIFLTQKTWALTDNTIYNFNYIQFIDNQQLYIIDNRSSSQTTVVKCNYRLDNRMFTLQSVQKVVIDKIQHLYTVVDYTTLKTPPTEDPYYFTENNHSLKINYLDEKNSYYLTDKNYKDAVKLQVANIAQFNLVYDLAPKETITKWVNQKAIQLGNEKDEKFFTQMDFKDGVLAARFRNQGIEYVANGTYKILDGQIVMDFDVRDAFVEEDKQVQYHSLSDGINHFTITLNVKKVDGRLVASIAAPSTILFPKEVENKMYELKQSTGAAFDQVPIVMSDTFISFSIRGKAFQFTQNQTTFFVNFYDDLKVDLLMQNDNMTEVVTGTYSIADGEIRIVNNNDSFNHGNYDQYLLGTSQSKTPLFLTISLFPKYNETQKQFYFAIYDGSQMDERKNADSFTAKNTIKNFGDYAKVTALKDFKEMPEFVPVNSTTLEKAVNQNNFIVNYMRTKSTPMHTESFSFLKDKKVNVEVKDQQRGVIQIQGTYKVDNNKIEFTYDTKQIVKPSQYYVAGAKETQTATLNMVQDVESGSLYLQLQQGVYLRFTQVAQSVAIETPKPADKTQLSSLVGKVLISENKEQAQVTLKNNGTFVENKNGFERTGTYAFDVGKIVLSYEKPIALTTQLNVAMDKNNIYIQQNSHNDFYYIYTEDK